MIFPAFDPQEYTVGITGTIIIQGRIRSIQDVFMKRPRIFMYAHKQTDVTAKHVAHEAKICDRLQQHYHPNFAVYYGVEHGGQGRIRGLCFLKYKRNLEERMDEAGNSLDKEACLAGVRRGIEFLHGLGQDPTNIMMGADHVPVLIDFSSTLEIGQNPKNKCRSGMGRWTAYTQRSCKENDFLALDMLARYLNGEVSI